MTLGHNAGSAQELMSFIERREQLEEQKKDAADDIKVVNAEVVAAGFVLKAVNAIIKIRRSKPHDVQESQALLDTYLHALGMAVDAPLERFVKNASVDRASLESVMAYLEPAVPPTGEGHFDIKIGARTWRLTRDLFGDVSRTEVLAATGERKPAADKTAKSFEKPPVPDVDEAGARALGITYARANRPVIENPFPYGDPRRARFDEGWREGSGGDGMGPKEDE